MGKSIFGYDPIIGCPFDDSALEMVDNWRGFSIGDTVEFLGHNELGTTHHPLIRGEVIAIGENAKYWDGEPFVAFAVRVKGSICFKTHRDIHHVI